LLLELVIDASVIAPKRACTYDGYINPGS